MRISRPKIRSSKGFVLTELVLGLAVVAAVVAIGVGAYTVIRGGISADDQGNKMISMAASIQNNWRNAGSYATLTGEELNKLALITAPMKFVTPDVTDGWGNTMTINGGPASFVMSVGGATAPINKDACASIANRLSSVAQTIRIGTSATGAAGVATGGNVFKQGETYTQASLGTGCNEPSTVIVAQFR
ncbi:hypothetical protein LJR118_006642 [Acidovorax sp. LjRoot118]|uniref:type IV pilus modification PilV family protein n=1 Tax=Acidovorax sp. LjRoot118 TaxID=3342256 RepID=UPI003ECC67E5